jgi:hypothetical protein
MQSGGYINVARAFTSFRARSRDLAKKLIIKVTHPIAISHLL